MTLSLSINMNRVNGAPVSFSNCFNLLCSVNNGCRQLGKEFKCHFTIIIDLFGIKKLNRLFTNLTTIKKMHVCLLIY